MMRAALFFSMALLLSLLVSVQPLHAQDQALEVLLQADPADTNDAGQTMADLARVLENRLGPEFGQSVVVDILDGNKIKLTIPGMVKPEVVLNLVTLEGVLEFRAVAEEVDPNAADIPEDVEILRTEAFVPDSSGGSWQEKPIPVMRTPLITGESIQEASSSVDPNMNAPRVDLAFTPRGAALFEEITNQLLGRRLAIVLDGKVVTAPVVQTPISGGKAVITGNFTVQEAQDLARALNSGPLPAPVTVLGVEQKP